MQYSDFFTQYNILKTFATECFMEYTEGWECYHGIESIKFTDYGIYLKYSMCDEEKGLFIPSNFMENCDVQGVVELWKAKDATEEA